MRDSNVSGDSPEKGALSAGRGFPDKRSCIVGHSLALEGKQRNTPPDDVISVTV
jgi:hypothetical protein